jgi:hypothetical protein
MLRLFKILKQIKQKIYFWAKSVFISGILFVPVLAKAQSAVLSSAEQTRCANFKKQFLGVFDQVPNYYCSASALLLWAINLMLMLAGTVSVVFIIVGGFWYLTSGGSEEQSEKGRKTLINAVIGLAVILMATAIIRVVSGILTIG